jgi:hypothetical protein
MQSAIVRFAIEAFQGSTNLSRDDDPRLDAQSSE